MDTQHLRTFLVLADRKNFTQAADQLFVAQSTVTNRIAELERQVGKKLFLRDKKTVSLTPEGNLFLTYAKRMIDLEESAIKEMSSIKQYEHSLRIGTTNTIYECHLVESMKQLLSSHTNCAFTVTVAHSTSLLQMLQDGLLDVIYSYLPLVRNGYRSDVFATDSLVLVTSPKNNTYHNGIRKEELTQIQYLFCNFALQEVGLFIRELFPPFYQFHFEIDNSTKLLQFLIDGMGYSFLPESLVHSYIEDGILETVPLLNFKTPKINSYRIYSEENPSILLENY
ncbi:LysR family transcriptional regulator [Anaerosporobacter faecicola]|uniref:LysR family transcriptional regulator n=1 Tax=Anaerosporobacter faecicola TaxID=2718714 RepID=UPI0014387634|nr:LysR family transcriptional regulator [Anaerosporobacter faecicola]